MKYHKMSAFSRLESFLSEEKMKTLDNEAFTQAVIQFLQKKDENENEVKENEVKENENEVNENEVKENKNEEVKKEPAEHAKKIFIPREFLRNNPTLEDFKNLSQEEFWKCVDYDRKQAYSFTQFVCNIEKTVENNPLVIFLIENGFPANDHTDNILKNNNLDLLKYYHRNQLVKKIYFIYHVIKNKNFEMLEYLLEQNLWTIKSVNNMHDVFKTCVEFDNIDMLEFFSYKFPQFFSQALSDSVLELRLSVSKRTCPQTFKISHDLYEWIRAEKQYRS